MSEAGSSQLTGASAPELPEPFDRRGFLLALLALVLAAGVLLSDSLLSSRVLSQADALEQFAPWSDDGAEEGVPSNPVLLDQAIVMQPWMHFGAERIQAGQAPWWNPDNYMGQPMVGTYQTAYFWPLNWVYFAAPGWWFLEWSALLRLVAAGLFTYLFLRALRLSAGPAILGAVTFALCGFQVAWLGHMHTHVSLFLPALLWGVERVARRASGRDAALLALMVAGALLAGHLQTALHVALAVGAWSLFRMTTTVAGTRLSRAGLGQLALGAGLGVLVAMPQLLPFFEYLGDSRGAVVLEQLQTVDRISPSDAGILMLDPGHHGSPAAAQGYGPYDGPSGQNVNFNELIGGYVGRLALLLALVGVWLGRRRREVWFLAGGAALAAAIAWQVPGIYDAVAAVPKLKSTKLMRFAVVLAFALACLAAFGLQGLAARLGGRARSLVAPAATLLVALELIAFGRGYNPTIEPAELAPATAVTDLLQERVASEPPFRVLSVDNTALMPSANLFYGVPMLAGYDSMELATTADLVQQLSTDERGAYFIKEIRSFDRQEALPLARLLGVRYLLSPADLPPPFELLLDGPTKVYRDPGAAPRFLAPTSARYLRDPGARLAYLGSAEFDPRVAVLETLPTTGGAASLGPALRAALEAGEQVPLAPLQGGLESYGDTEVSLRLAAGPPAVGAVPGDTHPDLQGSLPALAILTDAWDAGWTAELDGEPVEVVRVDHGLRGVWVPPGDHELVFRYEPRGLAMGLLLGLLGLVGTLALLLRRPRT
ncbi:MAG: YfhO family protein [Planctomycetota bacterium]|nr:YfhO family protein [Planctomycetota bacterium]